MLELLPRGRLRGLEDLREDRGVELAEHLRRPAAYIHAQPCLQVDDDIQRPLDGDPAALRVSALHRRSGGVEKPDDPVIERHHQIHGRGAFQRMFPIASHSCAAP